jgi:dihydroflavonol-4-reductase
MNVFVTGGTGLLGHNLIRRLLAEGHQVRALVRSPQKAQQLLGALPIEVVVGDLDDVSAWTKHLQGAEVVFHTAAFFREYYQPGNHWPVLEKLNVRATMQLLAAAEQAGVGVFVHTSSSGTIDMRANHQAGDESTALAPAKLANLYFRSKAVCDEQIDQYIARQDHQNNPIKIITIHPGWMIGPADAAPTGAGELILSFLAGKLPGLLDAGSSTVDARDVADAMAVAAERGQHGEHYIVGGRFVSFRDLFTTAAEVSGAKLPPITIPNGVMELVARADEARARLFGGRVTMPLDAIRTFQQKHSVDSTKAMRELGASFRPLRETLSDTVQWFRQHGYSS